MNPWYFIFWFYVLPLVGSLVMLAAIEFFAKKLNEMQYSAADVSPLAWLPLLNCILIVILPFGVVILGSEYFAMQFVKLIRKI